MSNANDYDEDLTTDAKPIDTEPNVHKEKLNKSKSDDGDTKHTKQIEEDVEDAIPITYKVNNMKKKKGKNLTNSPTANIINIANCNGVQIGKSITYNIQKKESKDESEKKQYQKTKTITKLFDCKERVNEDDLMFVSTHVGEGWRDIGRKLKYSDGQIYQFEETHRIKGIKEVVYQMLLDWIQNEPETATLGKLSTILWETQQEEVVHLLSTKLTL
ncbi:protein immune deficiency [Onthophagus taurus]|uniref:protein immune deficiency n=1 Tax=Onthophagus taurus TaxID=166361 RepID=UPI000C1FE767|nr:uncharacterized protein LOC111425509 [Onthophagus taurus]